MSKLALDFSLEDQVILDLEDCKQISIDHEIAGLNAAFEEINKLIHISNIVKNSSKDNIISLETRKIIDITLNSTKHNLNLVMPERVSLENADGNVNVCLEGISEFLARIWKAIVDTFKWIWDKITYLFRSKTSKIKDKMREIEIEKMKKEIKDIAKNKSTNTKTALNRPYINVHKYISPFDYKNDEYSSSEIIKDTRNLENKIKILKEAIDSVELTNNNLNEIFKSIKEIGDGSIASDFINSLSNETLYGYFANFVNNIHSDVDNKYRLKMNEHLPNKGINIERNNLKVINDLSNNGFIAFYINSSKENSANKFEIQVTQNIINNEENVKIQVMDIHDLETYVIASVDAYGKVIDLRKEYDTKYNQIEKKQKEALIILNEIFKEFEKSGNVSEVQNLSRIIRDSFIYVLVLADNASAAMSYVEKTTIDYIQLAQYMINYWKED